MKMEIVSTHAPNEKSATFRKNMKEASGSAAVDAACVAADAVCFLVIIGP